MPRITSKLVKRTTDHALVIEVRADGQLIVTLERPEDGALWQGVRDGQIIDAREENHLLDWIADDAETLPLEEFARVYPDYVPPQA